jgi:hypothetical protein
MTIIRPQDMEHTLVMPMHDPNGVIFPHLERITPALKAVFSGAVISVAPGEPASSLADPFYRTVTVAAGLPVGAQFRALYQYAAETCPPAAVLHLCFADRLAFQVDFLASIRGVQRGSLPLIFQRSPAAWATHPANYREIEEAIGMVSKWAFGRVLDFAWCHLAVEAGTLGNILPAVHRTDMSMMAEIIVRLIADIKTEDVDWLAWEDPFILGREAEELMREREGSLAETRKRLSYALPMMEVIYRGF